MLQYTEVLSSYNVNGIQRYLYSVHKWLTEIFVGDHTCNVLDVRGKKVYTRAGNGCTPPKNEIQIASMSQNFVSKFILNRDVMIPTHPKKPGISNDIQAVEIYQANQ